MPPNKSELLCLYLCIDDMSCSNGPSDVLIQRHIEPPRTFSFNRSWAEFRDGFNDSSGNFWIGNEKLYQATSVQDPPRRRLRVQFTDVSNNVSLIPSQHTLCVTLFVSR